MKLMMRKQHALVRSLMLVSIVSLAYLATGAMSASAQDALPAGGGRGRGGAGGAGGGQPPGPDAFVDRMMQSDANGDGKLSKDEVPGNFADRLFEGGDTDKDGFLTRDELKAVAATLPAGGGRGGAGGGQGGPGGGEQVSFRGYMNQAGRGMRGLSRSAFDAASRDGDLTAVGNVQAALVGAKSRSVTEPIAKHLTAKYGEDNTAFRTDLHKTLMKAILAAIDLETAILDGDSAAAKECLQKLDEAQNAGHETFQERDEPGDRRPPPGGGAGGGGGGGEN